MSIEQEYKEILKSGMFWVFFPEMTGEWEKDKQPFTEFYDGRARKLPIKSNLQRVTSEEIEASRCKAYKTIV